MNDYGSNENYGYGDYEGGYSEYGNQAAEGGGFIPNTTPSATPKGGKGKKDTSVPVTIRRLKAIPNTGNDDFVLDGKELGKISLVGRITAKDVKNVQITYTLDDSTGQIEVTEWINDGESTADAEEARDALQEGMLVKVFGQLRTFANKLSISAFAIRRIEDFNELTYHYISAIFTHLQQTKGPLNVSLKGVAPVFRGGPTEIDFSVVNQPVGPRDVAVNGDFTPMQQMVLNAFSEDVESEEGTNIQTVIQKLTGSVSPEDVRRIVFELQDDGHLYSTIDEEHFKSTVEED